VRTLIGLGLVLAILVGFAVGTILLPRWRTGEEKIPVVRGVVVPTRAQRATGPVQLYVALFAGKPRRVRLEDTPIDDGPEQDAGGRFRLAAGPDDGPTFFVHGLVELTTFERFCAEVPLPRVRVGDERWVDARTGGPVPSLRITPTRPC
jgi:hypothetical protein